MTPTQEQTSARTLLGTQAFSQPFIAIAAGLAVLMMALALTSFAFIQRGTAPSTQALDTGQTFDGWMPAFEAASRQARIAAAQDVSDGWEAALVPQRQPTVDGWEAVLVPQREPAIDGYIQRYLNND